MTSFSGLTNALSSLQSQSYGLDVTGENIANANNPGYTRQRADLEATGPVAGVSTLYATQRAGGSVGVSGTSRLNDPVVDARARAEHGQNGTLQANATTLSSVEGLFDEPSNGGLFEQLSDMWKSYAAVANNPGDAAARQVVLQKSSALASSLNAASAALGRITDSTNDEVASQAQQVNTATAALAKLNGSIAVATATGTNSNSLADQRDSLLMTLSDLTGAKSTINVNGTATVSIGGQTVVSSTTSTDISVASGQIVVGGTAVPTAGGSMQGLLNGLNTSLPKYAAQLDTVAAALATTVNTAQESGYDLAGNAGGPVFSGTTAATITVAITDPSKLAASSTPGGNLGGGVALAMSGLGTAAGGPDVTYRGMIGTLATDVAQATQQATVQQSVTTSVDNLAQSSAGVSLDEETTNLLTYQRAYQASSRVLTTIDDTLDTLINHTGQVGL